MICASAIDTLNVTSDLYCYTITVGIAEPEILTNSLSPVGLINLDFGSNITFSANFDKMVKRTTSSGFIKLIDALTNTTVATIDTINNSSMTLKNNKITFSFGFVFQSFSKYYITIDEGRKNIFKVYFCFFLFFIFVN